MISSPDFDAFADIGIDLGDLEGDKSGLKELLADSAADRLVHGSTRQPRSPHGGAEKRPQLPDSVIAMPRTFRIPILQVPNLDNAANLLKHANNQVLPASVRRDENMPDVPQNAPAARRLSTVDVTRKQVVGNNGASGRMLLPPKSGLSAPSKSSANGVGAAPRPSGHAAGSKKKAHQPGEGVPKAVDIATSIRFDNISNNILANL